MNIRLALAAAALLAATSAASAQEPLPLLPSVQAVQQVFDCQLPRSLPTQAQVGAWTGQHNFTQVYATRQRLMAEVARACKKPGIEQVNLVMERRPASEAAARRGVARIEPHEW